MLGQVVYKNTIMAKSGVMNEQVSLSKKLANGTYILNLRSDSDNKMFHIIIDK
jgi:hypothetical protein